MKTVIFYFETLTDLGNLLTELLFEICRLFVATAFFFLYCVPFKLFVLCGSKNNCYFTSEFVNKFCI